MNKEKETKLPNFIEIIHGGEKHSGNYHFPYYPTACITAVERGSDVENSYVYGIAGDVTRARSDENLRIAEKAAKLELNSERMMKCNEFYSYIQTVTRNLKS